MKRIIVNGLGAVTNRLARYRKQNQGGACVLCRM